MLQCCKNHWSKYLNRCMRKPWRKKILCRKTIRHHSSWRSSVNRLSTIFVHVSFCTSISQSLTYTLSSHHLSWLNYSPTHLYVNNSWNTGIAKIERHTTPCDICWDICQICGKHGESEAITVHPIERTLQTRCHRSQACNGLHGNQ